MSQLNSMAIPMEGKYSNSELLELKNKMNAKALAKRRSKTALRLAANIIFAILILLPLLYAVSIALMPSNELFTTDLNLFPKHPSLQNFKEAFTTVPLLRFILNSFIMAGCITIGQMGQGLYLKRVKRAYSTKKQIPGVFRSKDPNPGRSTGCGKSIRYPGQY